MAQEATLEGARKALDKHAWDDAFAILKRIDATTGLDAKGLEALAEASWWTAQPAENLAARERSYNAFLAAGDKPGAAQAALWLVRDYGTRGAVALAQAWLERAEKLVAGDEDSVAFGYVLFIRSFVGLTPDPHEELDVGRRVSALGERHGDRDLTAYGLMLQAIALIGTGDVTNGLATFDRATIAAVADEVDPWTTGMIYCATIAACRDIGDFRRAADWTEATSRWCERQSINGFPGICRVHRAEILDLRGSWAQAEQEARHACDELQRYEIGPVLAQGFYEIGMIRLRMGDLPAAESAFRQAHGMGMTPEPGLSLVRLAEGDPAAAMNSLRRALANELSKPGRARLLPAVVEVALAAGEPERAREAATEMHEIASGFGTAAMKATAHVANASVLLANGQRADAEVAIRSAIRLWQEVNAPYEVARARVVLAAVLRGEGDPAAERLELDAARATFERLGARLEAKRTTDLLGAPAGGIAPEADRLTKTFLFTDIVRSTKLVEAIGDEAWQDLIRWHDETLRSLIAEFRGEEIRHQGDGFFVAFAKATDAIECAIAIQRRLAEQRRAQGFALQVRIGMHTAPAHRRGLDYAGFGIHEAARIGAVAEGGEIVVTGATIESAGATYRTQKRNVSLKDIPDVTEVLAVEWR
ncbi:MAG: adenylate/guanylate cyclase domain-containing protein [Chloroflexota bacterium]